MNRSCARKEICICAGAGGVGKTTTSAAIAAGMAARGKKVVVLTIDPARRLANSLGLPELGNEERRVAGDFGDGELWAMMLDAKRTFDELIEWHAPDEETRDAVLGNRIYQQLSNAVAGSQEYMAMEKLHELHQEGRYDLLVLDTPPTRNALDFLDAPKRLSSFIDSRSLQLFTTPGRLGLRVLGRGTGVVVLDHEARHRRRPAPGPVGILPQLRRPCRRASASAPSGSTACSPTAAPRSCSSPRPRRTPIDEAIFFHRRLRDSGLPFAGAVVNRMHPLAASSESTMPLPELLGEDLARKVARNLEDYRVLAERDRRNLDRLRSALVASR